MDKEKFFIEEQRRFMDVPLRVPCLTVCVACKGIAPLLKANLSALDGQTLDKKQWEIVLLISEERQAEIVDKALKLFSLRAKLLTDFHKNSLQNLRNQALNSIKTPLIFFIDEDVTLENPDHLKTLVYLHKQHEEETVLGGGYLSLKGCSFWGLAYNWVVRLWMVENPGFVPAGNLSVKTAHLNRACHFKSPLSHGFGGEEVYFLNQIQATSGKSLWKKELDASHQARHTLKDFLKRAIVHGQSQAFQQISGTSFYKSVRLFIKQKGSLKVKIPALFYLFLVRLISFAYRLKRKIKTFLGPLKS